MDPTWFALLDARAFRVIHDALSDRWLWPMAVLSAVGGGWGALTLVPLLAAERTRRMGRSLALVLATQATLVFVLKRLFMRERPFGSLRGVHALVFDAPRDFSFPSGHAAGSFAFAVFLGAVLLEGAARRETESQRWGLRAAALGLLVFAVGVGLSRIALGVHFPADVLAGAAIGTVVAAVGVRVHRRLPTETVQVR
jgi:undecaprenyl-diphosphatase